MVLINALSIIAYYYIKLLLFQLGYISRGPSKLAKRAIKLVNAVVLIQLLILVLYVTLSI